MASTSHQSRKRRLDSISSTGESERKKLKAYSERDDSLRSLATCKVCFRLLYEPYTLGCGHTYCYSCLCQWFDNAEKKKKTCPDCRSVITKAPAPAYVLREMVRELIRRAELLPLGESLADHKANEIEEAALVERDKANTDPIKGGLFKGRFLNVNAGLGPIQDFEDGVMRCPQCSWELEDDGEACDHCGFTILDDSHDESWPGGDHLSGESSDDEELDGDLDMDDAEFDESVAATLETYSNPLDRPGYAAHLARLSRVGTPSAGFASEFQSSSPTYHTAGSDASGEDDSSDDDSSLDGFVARDEEAISGDSESDSDNSTSTTTQTPVSSARRARRVIDEDEDDDEEEADEPVITSARNIPRYSVSSSEESETDESDVQILSSRQREHSGHARSRSDRHASVSATTSTTSGSESDSDKTDRTGGTASSRHTTNQSDASTSNTGDSDTTTDLTEDSDTE